MIPEFGQFALILAWCFAMMLMGMPIYAKRAGETKGIHTARTLVYAQAFFIGLAFISLIYCFVANDFSVLYVLRNSSRELPLWYRIPAVWGAHEGSMLLWMSVLSLWMIAVARFSQDLPKLFAMQVLAVLGAISVGFLLFLLATSNPFLRVLPQIPNQGQDLNPLLQDPGFLGHPPMLYMGYVGFAVPYAFAVAALLTGKMDSAWVRWVRPWTQAAWCFLTLGIILGSWWAYRVLGWGGWWFWDPVENASFLPWLVATALLHTLLVAQKRGVFIAWVILLSISAFALSVLGTFLVRSGILTSVHAFAIDPKRGIFMLLYLAAVVGLSLGCFAWRIGTVKSHHSLNVQLGTRETLLLGNNLLLFVAMATVLLGTLYPLIMQILNWGKLSVGAPYFNTVFIPLISPLLFLLAIGPHTRWYQHNGAELTKRLWKIILFAMLAATLVLLFYQQMIVWRVWLGLFLSFWIILATFSYIYQWQQLHWGMVLAHLGVAICVIGITLTSHYSVERDVRMSPGDTITLSDYQFNFNGTQRIDGANYSGIRADFTVLRDGVLITDLQPEKRYYAIAQTALAQAAIASNVWRDLYIALGEPLNAGTWTVRIYYKPFVRWIWGGGLLMFIGGVVTGFTQIRRRGQEQLCP